MSRSVEGPGEVSVTPLSRERLADFKRLLRREVSLWKQKLAWDFSSTATALETALSTDCLPGFLAASASEPLGYIYWIKQRDKTVIGSLFSEPRQGNRSVDAKLFRQGLESVLADARQRRIEGQLLYLGSAPLEHVLAALGFTWCARTFMMVDLRKFPHTLGAIDPPGYRVVPFADVMIPSAARLVHRSYVGMIDATMSECYQTGWGCLSFVNTIVKRNGIGKFCRAASWVALDETGQVAGVVLASVVSKNTGHIPQISVGPEHQGKGLGRRLIQACLESFRLKKTHRVSLSVTNQNTPALKLYQDTLFEPVLEFPAFYWVRNSA